MKNLENIVIFRQYKNHGDIIALFPYDIQNIYGSCNSYMRIGQHGSAHYQGVIRDTQPISKDSEEVKSLLEELESIGYEGLVIRKQLNASYMEQAMTEFNENYVS